MVGAGGRERLPGRTAEAESRPGTHSLTGQGRRSRFVLRPGGRLALLGRHRPGPSEGYLAPSEERRTRHQLPPGMCVASLLENGTEESQKPVRGGRCQAITEVNAQRRTT